MRQKKADVAETPQDFDHAGLLFNQPPGTAGLPFNESSELELSDATEPIPNSHRLRAAGIVPSGTREISQCLFSDWLASTTNRGNLRRLILNLNTMPHPCQ